MCVILLSSGLMLSMLGILGEYLWRALDASRQRPTYLIDEELETRKAKEQTQVPHNASPS